MEPFDVSEPYRVEHVELRWARIDGSAYRATVWRPATDRPTRSPWATLLDVPGGPWACFDRSVDFYFDRKLAACGAVVVAIVLRRPRFVRRQRGDAWQLDQLHGPQRSLRRHRDQEQQRHHVVL